MILPHDALWTCRTVRVAAPLRWLGGPRQAERMGQPKALPDELLDPLREAVSWWQGVSGLAVEMVESREDRAEVEVYAVDDIPKRWKSRNGYAQPIDGREIIIVRACVAERESSFAIPLLAHELGHALKLKHGGTDSVMLEVKEPYRESLGADDVETMQALYGKPRS